MKTSIRKTILWLTLFSIAMGFLETAVVVYLRELYYPQGFSFPLKPIPPGLALTEFMREAATLVMLVGVGILSGRNRSERFVHFLYSFALWDLCYYLFLKVILNWPDSLFTWDILFLIPVPWVGPVLAPCILCLAMVLLMFIYHYHSKDSGLPSFVFSEVLCFITGSVICIFSFVWDYVQQVSLHPEQQVWTLSGKRDLFSEIAHYRPESFNWWLFSTGLGLIITGISLFHFHQKK